MEKKKTYAEHQFEELTKRLDICLDKKTKKAYGLRAEIVRGFYAATEAFLQHLKKQYPDELKWQKGDPK